MSAGGCSGSAPAASFEPGIQITPQIFPLTSAGAAWLRDISEQADAGVGMDEKVMVGGSFPRASSLCKVLDRREWKVQSQGPVPQDRPSPAQLLQVWNKDFLGNIVSFVLCTKSRDSGCPPHPLGKAPWREGLPVLGHPVHPAPKQEKLKPERAKGRGEGGQGARCGWLQPKEKTLEFV